MEKVEGAESKAWGEYLHPRKVKCQRIKIITC
jgi:hypothetical protein